VDDGFLDHLCNLVTEGLKGDVGGGIPPASFINHELYPIDYSSLVMQEKGCVRKWQEIYTQNSYLKVLIENCQD